MEPGKVDLHFICRGEIEPQNCTSPEVISQGHLRDMSNVYSKEYEKLYTTGQNATLFCNFTGDPYPKISWQFKGISTTGPEKDDLDPDVTSDGQLFLRNVTP